MSLKKYGKKHTIPEQTRPGLTLREALENSSADNNVSQMRNIQNSALDLLSNGEVSVNFDWSQLKISMKRANANPPPRIMAYPEDCGKYATNSPFAIANLRVRRGKSTGRNLESTPAIT